MNQYNATFFRIIILAIGTVALCVAMALTFTACGTTTPSQSQAEESAASSQPDNLSMAASSEASSESIEEETAKLIVADAAMYRGTVVSIDAMTESGSEILLLTLKSVDGTGFTPSTLPVAITVDTKLSFEREKLEKNAYLEVYYGGEPTEKQQYAKAIAVNLLVPAERSVFNGELVEVMRQEGSDKVSLLLKPLGEGMETVFHISDETQVYLNLDELKAGDKLNIYYNGIATFSIPPQSTAMEIRRYTAPVAEK
ncbi:hypothetical protein [Hydrogenoanaerobacterium sp.]|uniref:hypothetical protein n=1 Tax=Hydrogenoanaerobacterium sp. TaxID=2953763 RepID=UPI00289CCD0F|nr:hypothetical protein [Hydrogenoanaerobacterium sp.]